MVLCEGERLYSYYSFVGSVTRQAILYRFADALKDYNTELLYENRSIGRESMDVVIFLCYPYDAVHKKPDVTRKYSVVLVGERYIAFELQKDSNFTVEKIIAEPDCFDPETKMYKTTHLKPIWAYSKDTVDNYIAETYTKDRTARFYGNRHTFLDNVRIKLTGSQEDGNILDESRTQKPDNNLDSSQKDDNNTSTGRCFIYTSQDYYLVPKHHLFLQNLLV